jgi:hypothetical protein
MDNTHNTSQTGLHLRKRVKQDNSISMNNRNDKEHILMNPPPPEAHHRSLDEFLESAYASKSSCSNGSKWKYWLVMLSLGVANSSDASEILCISYLLSEKNFGEQILQNTAWRGGLLASTVFFGMFVGGLFVGTMGDWVGRRPMLMVGLMCNAVAGILSSLATNVWMLSVLRCIAGVGIGATVPPLFTLVTELAPPSERYAKEIVIGIGSE